MLVSIHASSREDATHAPLILMLKIMFQSTRPRGRTRQPLRGDYRGDYRFQSTRPRGRTRRVSDCFTLKWDVSIHASSREDATSYLLNCTAQISFNPRVLAGGRDFRRLAETYAFPVSIHASSREDATFSVEQDVNTCSFNPRVLAGGRDSEYPRSDGRFRFQSTRPRGRTRLMLSRSEAAGACFNPRVLAGGRDTSRSSSRVSC